MKKLLALLLCMIFMLSVVPAMAYTAGTYTGTGMGLYGEIKVGVTFDENAITQIEILANSETPTIAGPALEQIPAAIVAHQSLAVDTISGATLTSNGILAAVEDAVKQAGGDVDALKAVVVEKENAPKEDVEMTADVVILGGGGAGLAAATAAAQQGASVIIVEKTSAFGGNTALSGGYMQSSVEEMLPEYPMSDEQKAELEAICAKEPHDEYEAKWIDTIKKGFEAHNAAGNEYRYDSPEVHAFLTYSSGNYVGRPELIEKVCNTAVDTFYWMGEMGFPWVSSLKSFDATTLTRMKTSSENASGMGGVLFIDFFAEQLEKLGVSIVYNCAGQELIENDGKIVGVVGTADDGTKYTFNANKSVILATGGFAANAELCMQYDDTYNLTASIPATGVHANTGEGLMMALDKGAGVTGIEYIQTLDYCNPTTGNPKRRVGTGVLYVNKNGERFRDETILEFEGTISVMAQPDGYYYMISTFENSSIKTAEDGTLTSPHGVPMDTLLSVGDVVMADTLEELAAKIEVPVDALKATVEKYNQYCDDGVDPDFGRTNLSAAKKLDMNGPFYACKQTVGVHNTMGGLLINTDCQVLTENNEVIPGLYAAGEVTGGFHGGGRLSGNAITEALTEGYIAGQTAAK